MNVVVSQEHRFDRTPDGTVWTQAAFPRSYYCPYLEVFDTVRVVARVRDVNAPPPSAKRADGDGVSFHAVPYYLGPKQYLLRLRQIRQALRSAVRARDAVIFRVQSQIAAGIEPELYRRNHPYALEVMCDPYEMFAPGSNDHPLRSVFRTMFYRQLKRQCSRAAAVSYVTENSLQRIYPPSPTAFSVSYSTVELPPEAYVSTARPVSFRPSPLTIITVASLDQPYKGIDVLIDAVLANVAAGLDLRLLIAGDGIYRSQLEARAEGLGDRVQFLGQVPSGSQVRGYLDGADFFVLPSRTEGLPRAMIEAMARALPCLGSAVGGIPELLPPSDLVQSGDSPGLVSKIREIAQSPERMAAMSARNLRKSQYYASEILRSRRNNFYCHLRDLTERWLRETNRHLQSAVLH